MFTKYDNIETFEPREQLCYRKQTRQNENNHFLSVPIQKISKNLEKLTRFRPSHPRLRFKE